MYTRSYNEDGIRTIPEGYSGTMLDDTEHIPEVDKEIREQHEAHGKDESAPAMSWLGKLGGGFSSLFDIPLFKNMKIGTEELLIGATALFLLFSKNGDKECAIMLLLLLFIT